MFVSIFTTEILRPFEYFGGFLDDAGMENMDISLGFSFIKVYDVTGNTGEPDRHWLLLL
jgi:hypothetical protein